MDVSSFYAKAPYQAPVVDFEMRADEDRDTTIADGVTRWKNTPYAVVRPIGDRNTVIERPAKEWLASLAANREMPEEIKERFRNGFERWLKGETQDLDGTPISVGGVFSPAEQQQFLAIHVRTLEAAANMPEEGIRQYGMGGRDARDKARSYLASVGTDTQKLAAELNALRIKLQTLEADNKNLRTRLDAQPQTPPAAPTPKRERNIFDELEDVL